MISNLLGVTLIYKLHSISISLHKFIFRREESQEVISYLLVFVIYSMECN